MISLLPGLVHADVISGGYVGLSQCACRLPHKGSHVCPGLDGTRLSVRLIVRPCWRAWQGHWDSHTSPKEEQLLTGFIKQAQGYARMIRRIRSICRHIFHTPDKVNIDMRRDTPRFNDTQFDISFFNACRTVSMLMVSTSPENDPVDWSAQHREVQWHSPWDGVSCSQYCTNCCSKSPLILIFQASAAAWIEGAVDAFRHEPFANPFATLARLVPKARDNLFFLVTPTSGAYGPAKDTRMGRFHAVAAKTEHQFSRCVPFVCCQESRRYFPWQNYFPRRSAIATPMNRILHSRDGRMMRH